MISHTCNKKKTLKYTYILIIIIEIILYRIVKNRAFIIDLDKKKKKKKCFYYYKRSQRSHRDSMFVKNLYFV